MNIALLGFGTVGKGVYEIIRRKASSDTAAIEVSHILIYEDMMKDDGHHDL